MSEKAVGMPVKYARRSWSACVTNGGICKGSGWETLVLWVSVTLESPDEVQARVSSRCGATITEQWSGRMFSLIVDDCGISVEAKTSHYKWSSNVSVRRRF